MPRDRFLIAPYDQNSGVQTNYKPWLIPDQAFAQLDNAYVFRGRVRKRFGSRWLDNSQLLSRLRIQVDVIAAGTATGNVRVNINDALLTPAVGQAFSVGDTLFTVYNSAVGPQQMYRTDGLASVATYDLTNSDYNITNTGAADGTPVYFYPALPVMGLLSVDGPTINNEPVIGFDRRYAYQYANGWQRLANETNPGDAVWNGSDSQFFWGTTWTGQNVSDRIFFVTNFNETEPNFMRYYNVSTTFWTTFNPLITAADRLVSARIIVPFKNRLVAFNTWEGAVPTQYPQRARYSQAGSPLDPNAWRADIPGLGNAVDASTTESIITVEFIKDRLIVYFERSTWELVFTGNQAYPFVWQKINTELGAESTFSVVPFDKVALGIGNVGIHACSGTNVERIDQKIPQLVFDIHNADEGINRVYGIRDFRTELVYWTLPAVDATATFPYPTRVLIYNYVDSTWGLADDSITAFGYFQPVNGITWDSEEVTWDDEVPWNSGAYQAQALDIIAGNQEGYTFIIDPNEPINAPVLQITNITLSQLGTAFIATIDCIDHNLRQGDYVYLQDMVGTLTIPNLNDLIYPVIDNATYPLTRNQFSVEIDPSIAVDFASTYNGGGVISRVSQIRIRTKEYNFYLQQGRNAFVQRVDFNIDRTDNGKILVDYFVSTSGNFLVEDGQATGMLLGTSVLTTSPYPSIPFEQNATRLWHPVYLQADGECIQLYLYLNDALMKDVGVRNSDFQLHAMVIHAMPTSSRLQ